MATARIVPNDLPDALVASRTTTRATRRRRRRPRPCHPRSPPIGIERVFGMGRATRCSMSASARRPRPRPRGHSRARTSRRDESPSRNTGTDPVDARGRVRLSERGRDRLSIPSRASRRTRRRARASFPSRASTRRRGRDTRRRARRISSPSRRGTATKASSDSPHCAAAIAAHVERVGEEDASSWTSTRRDTRSIAAESAHEKSLVASRCRPRDRATTSRTSREADSRTADSRVGSCPESSFARVARRREGSPRAFEMPRLERRCRRRRRTSRTMRRRSARRTRRRRRATTRTTTFAGGDASNAHARGDASNAHAERLRRRLIVADRSRRPRDRRDNPSNDEAVVRSRRVLRRRSRRRRRTLRDGHRRYPPNARDARHESVVFSSVVFSPSIRRRRVTKPVMASTSTSNARRSRSFARSRVSSPSWKMTPGANLWNPNGVGSTPSTSRRTRRRTALAFDESRRRRTRRARFSSRA